MPRSTPESNAERLVLLQLNAQHSRLVTDEIRGLVHSKCIDVLLLQEPYSIGASVPGFGSTARVVSGDPVGENRNVQAAIIVFRRTANVVALPQLCDSHCACALITTASANMYLVSLYFQFSWDIEIGIRQLTRVLRELRGRRVLISIDANANSPSWGSDTLCDRGEKLDDLIAQLDLVVLNREGAPATFSSAAGESHIDVTLVTREALAYVQSWEVRESWTTSDHNAIVIRLGNQDLQVDPPPQEARFLLAKANWTLFRAALSRERGRYIAAADLGNSGCVVRMAEELERVLVTACSESMPTKKWRSKPVPWWTTELTELKRRVYRGRRAFQAARSPEERTRRRAHYLSERRVYVAAVKRARTEGWKNFVARENEQFGVAYRVAFDKFRVDRAVTAVGGAGRAVTMDWETTAARLLEVLVPDDSVVGETDEHRAIRAEVLHVPDTEDTRVFSGGEIRNAVFRLRRNRCPGIDRVEAEALQQSFSVLKEDLLRLYNACLEHATFPGRWKEGSIRVLLKSPGRDMSNPKSYRPICLLSVLGKVLETLVSQRLEPIFGHEGRASDRQYGFRRGRSTEGAIALFRSLVANRAERYVLALSFDVSGAFDNVLWHDVLWELKERGTPRNLYLLMRDYFANRRVSIRSHQSAVEKQVSKGCPQGSVLGPRCWNLVFDSLLLLLEPLCEPIAYADDLLIVIYGESRNDLQVRGQRVADEISRWCLRKKHTIAAEKSVMTLMKGRLDPERSPIIRVDGVNVRMKPSLKYLGVTFDSGLRVHTHCANLLARGRSMAHGLMRIARQRWGLKHETLRTLYNGVLRPALTYAAAGWIDLTTQGDKALLCRAQRHALLRVTRSLRTVSTDALPVLAGVLPIDLELIEQACRYRLRHGESAESFLTILDLPRETVDRVTSLRALRKVVLGAWQERWSASDKGQITRSFFPDVGYRLESQKWLQVDHCTSQLLTGHGHFRSYRAMLGLVEEPLCECGEVETPTHVLYECPRLENERQPLREAVARVTDLWPPDATLLVSRPLYYAFKTFAREVLVQRR